jgi:hypothetical protein
MAGRPPKKPNERQANILKICLTDAERAKLESAADGKVSSWARDVLLRAAGRRLQSK